MPSLQETPCLRKERSVPSLMWNVTLALCTLLVLPTVYYGWRPLAMAFVTVALCCLAEVAVCLVRRRTIHSDPSLLVTGLVIALLMPVNAPFWMPAVAALFAVLVVRAPFGGTGCTPFNPAAAGVAFVTICWPERMFSYVNSTIGWVLPVFGDCTYMEVRSPAGVLKEGLKPDIVPLEMLWGRFVGPMGTTAMLVIGACGLFLVFRRIANWEAPVFFLLAAALWAALCPRIACSPLTSVKYELMSGSLFFCAVFMVTDPVTAPRTAVARSIYGAFCGALVMAFRQFGAYEQGACFAILASNAIAPLLDRAAGAVRVWGGKIVES